MITEKDLKTLFTSDEIQNAIKELGVRINSDYGDDELFLICVLKGAVMFTVDLSKHLKMPVHMEFIRLSSYGSGFASTGKVNAVDISPGFEWKECINSRGYYRYRTYGKIFNGLYKPQF